jgi:FlaA1/EpsC-like NDP-sugar epimerase
MLQAFGVYQREYGLAQIEELAWILRSSFMAVVITFAFTFATRQLLFSRFVLLFAFPAASISVAVWHWLFHRVSRKLALERGRGIRVAVYGSGVLASELASFMQKRASVPYEIAGFPASVMSPAAGAQGELCGLMMIRAYHVARGNPRHKVLIPDTAHGTNPASAAFNGYATVQLESGPGLSTQSQVVPA